jgi:hypothetical protein
MAKYMGDGESVGGVLLNTLCISYGQGNILFVTKITAGAAGIFNNHLLATTSLRNRSRICPMVFMFSRVMQ